MDCCHLWMHTMMIPLQSSVGHSLLVCWHSVQRKHLTDCRECTSSPPHQLVHMMLNKQGKNVDKNIPTFASFSHQFSYLNSFLLRKKTKTTYFKNYLFHLIEQLRENELANHTLANAHVTPGKCLLYIYGFF